MSQSAESSAFSDAVVGCIVIPLCYTSLEQGHDLNKPSGCNAVTVGHGTVM